MTMSIPIDKTPTRVRDTVDPITGLNMYRQLLYPAIMIQEDYIKVSYNQWLVTENDAIVNFQSKIFKIIDIIGGAQLYTTFASASVTEDMIGLNKLNLNLIPLRSILAALPFAFADGDYITSLNP